MTIALHESAEEYEREYQQVRAAFVARGTSLNAWLKARGIERQIASRALKGKSFGRRAILLRMRILKEAGCCEAVE